MKQLQWWSWPGAAVVLVAIALCMPCPRARAFGGLWSTQSTPVRQTGAQIIFVDDPGPTVTAIVRVEYSGPAQEFVWLIPVPTVPTVAISSSTVFERLETATAPEYWLEVGLDRECRRAGLKPGELPEAPGGPDLTIPPALPSDRGTVGPYDYVRVPIDHDGDDPVASASEWLASNGYRASEVDREALAPYLDAGFELFAFKLRAGMDVGAIRPVALTYESELPTVPLRATVVAAQQDLDVKVWVVGPSQAVPENYDSLVLNLALLDWLSAARFPAGTLPGGGAGLSAGKVDLPANYAALVTAAANEAGGRGFVSELGEPVSQFRAVVWGSLDEENFAGINAQSFDDGLDAVIAAGDYYRGWDGWLEAVAGASTLPDGLSVAELADNPDAYRGRATVDSAKFLELLASEVVAPVAQTAALLLNGPYLTRLYTTISADEVTADPVFVYNPELAQISNVHIARQVFACKVGEEDPRWRVELPQGGVVLGETATEWPLALDALPANLKIVGLSTSGSGEVRVDNSDLIAGLLFGLADEDDADTAWPRLPQHGLTIGGSQRIPPTAVPADPDDDDGGDEDDGDERVPKRSKASSGCAVAGSGRYGGGGFAIGLIAAAILLARRRRARSVLACFLALSLLACSDDAEDDGTMARDDSGAPIPAGALSEEQMRDPESCRGCHPTHYREWSGSMHAYAAKDPVFLAMNARGQRETKGELGDFCVRCHAPMAVVDGFTRDGLNLDELPERQRGVTCFFCHNVEAVEGDHNAQLRLAGDSTMRGGISDPAPTRAHGSAYSRLFDDERPESSAMCGTCHDIVTPKGVHLERTYEEYLTGIFSKSANGEPPSFDSCVGCHMPPRDGLAAVAPGAGLRTINEHVWPGIDVALTDFPHRAAMRSAVEDCQLNLGISFLTLEVTEPDLFTIQLETAAGHNTPSGAAHDRRMWIELMAYDDAGKLIDKSGDIADGELEEHPPDHPEHDPQLLMFRDYIYDERERPVHMFWEAAKSKRYPLGYESKALPVSTTTYIEGKHALVKQYRLASRDGKLPARVTARLRMRPMGLDVLQDLVDSGDLDPAVMAEMPTFTFGTQLEWTREHGVNKPLVAPPKPADCSNYRCLIHPGAKDCL